MQVTKLEIKGLFGRFDHLVTFPAVDESDPSSSVTILYGINGVGKTTVLKFLDALLREERGGAFDVFRTVPFHSCEVSISDTEPFTVWPATLDGRSALRIEFEGETGMLGGDIETRDLPEGQDEAGRALLHRFEEATYELSFQFVQTARLEPPDDRETAEARYITTAARRLLARSRQEREPLSIRMRRFISDAQLDYRAFFASSGTEVFAEILERLTSETLTQYTKEDLIGRLDTVVEQDRAAERFGLQREEWDYEELVGIIKSLPASGDARERTAPIIAQYVETLEARAVRRGLVADRLSTFEAVMNGFFAGKKVKVNAEEGLHIETDGEEPATLTEQQLSSGERHLLYLMASAVMTRRKGTVIAIDEPEMSMHVAWQKELIPALMKCAARAEPQFIFATHSPEVIANYQDRLVELVATPSNAEA